MGSPLMPPSQVQGQASEEALKAAGRASSRPGCSLGLPALIYCLASRLRLTSVVNLRLQCWPGPWQAAGAAPGSIGAHQQEESLPQPAGAPAWGGGLRTGPPAKAGLHKDILGFQDLHTGIQPKVPDPGPVLCLCCFMASGLSSVGLRWRVGWRGWAFLASGLPTQAHGFVEIDA